jgi:selenocysteine lyase/cysteine desulfurase
MPAYSRRDFARLLALSGSAALLPERVLAQTASIERYDVDRAPLPPTPAEPDEKFWREVRSRFLLPRDLAFFNAANLCPMSLPVVEALERNTRQYETNPSPATRAGLMQGREEARRLLATALRVTPEEIVITRNTSEANNLVSSGLQLGPDDEVVVFGDNHPSNLAAWREKSRRFGFTVSVVPQVQPHPGQAFYVDAFTKALSARTRVLAITHVTSNAGDVLPVADLCRVARERGVLTLVDGAQSFGVLDVDLSAMGADFYTGSAHKWPCGPKETGVLFVRREVHDRIWPSVVSLYAGAVGISQKLEANGQRDDASIAAFAEALRFRDGIGRAAIDQRARDLARYMIDSLRRMDGVTLYTPTDPKLSAAIVVFRPGSLDPRKLATALNDNDRIVCTVRAGADRPGLRLSPHLYNTMEETERVLGAIRRYLKSGV